jgi:hypothetical protein
MTTTRTDLPPSRSLLTFEAMRRWAAFLLLLAALFVGQTIVLRNVFTSRNPGGNDLLPYWVGTRGWLLEGLNPYDPILEQRAQLMTYGRLATEPGDYLMNFLYLPYTMLLVAPVALLPFDWAHAAWMTLQQYCLAGIAIAALRLWRWSPPAWLAAAIVLWAIVAYPGARAILLGQMAVLMALLVVLGLLAVCKRRDVLAAALLALSMSKPTLAVLVIPFVFLWSLSARRWRLAGGMAAAFAVLGAFSFVVAPNWLSVVVRQTLEYPDHALAISVVDILAQQAPPDLARIAHLALIAILLVWMLVEWARSRGRPGPAFEWAAMVTIVVTLLISPATGTTSQPLLYPALIMLFARLDRAGVWSQAWRRGYILLALIVAGVGIWWIFIITVTGRQEHPAAYLPLPLGVAAALLAAGRGAPDTHLD